MFFAIMNLVTGLFLVWFGLLVKATGDSIFLSTFAFKVIPVLLGFVSLLEGLKQMGWI